jgi:hypothetical protein
MNSLTPTLDEFRMLAAGFRNASLSANVFFYAVMKPDRLRAIARELGMGVTPDRRTVEAFTAAAEIEGPTGIILEGVPIVCSSQAVGISMRPGSPR